MFMHRYHQRAIFKLFGVFVGDPSHNVVAPFVCAKIDEDTIDGHGQSLSDSDFPPESITVCLALFAHSVVAVYDFKHSVPHEGGNGCHCSCRKLAA